MKSRFDHIYRHDMKVRRYYDSVLDFGLRLNAIAQQRRLAAIEMLKEVVFSQVNDPTTWTIPPHSTNSSQEKS